MGDISMTTIVVAVVVAVVALIIGSLAFGFLFNI